MNDIFISPGEARQLIPVFRTLRDTAPISEMRRVAGEILRKLSFVRSDIDYSPVPGYQLILNDKEYKFFTDVRDVMGV